MLAGAAPGHAVVAAAGVLTSVALASAMAIMVASFRDSVDQWLGQVLPADLYLRAGPAQTSGYLEPDMQARIGDWRLEQEGDLYRAEVRGDGFAYALSLIPDGPPLLNGAAGFSTQAPDPRHASFYYSRPQLRVSGGVTLDGRPQAVTGLAWLDHEWSSELLPEGAQGWDWVGLNLGDGSAIMAFRLRGQDAGFPCDLHGGHGSQ